MFIVQKSHGDLDPSKCNGSNKKEEQPSRYHNTFLFVFPITGEQFDELKADSFFDKG